MTEWEREKERKSVGEICEWERTQKEDVEWNIFLPHLAKFLAKHFSSFILGSLSPLSLSLFLLSLSLFLYRLYDALPSTSVNTNFIKFLPKNKIYDNEHLIE